MKLGAAGLLLNDPKSSLNGFEGLGEGFTELKVFCGLEKSPNDVCGFGASFFGLVEEANASKSVVFCFGAGLEGFGEKSPKSFLGAALNVFCGFGVDAKASKSVFWDEILEFCGFGWEEKSPKSFLGGGGAVDGPPKRSFALDLEFGPKPAATGVVGLLFEAVFVGEDEKSNGLSSTFLIELSKTAIPLPELVVGFEGLSNTEVLGCDGFVSMEKSIVGGF